MRLWATEIKAIDPVTGKVRVWPGDPVPGIDLEDAKAYVKNRDMGYMRVLGELIYEVDTSEMVDKLLFIVLN